jgi:hypothetical protein
MASVTPEMIADLPDPVQRSLRRSGVVDREIPAAVSVRQEGEIRTSADAKWLRFTAVEEYQLDPPGFDWRASLKIAGMTLGRATDSLKDGHGRMRVRLLGLSTVVDATGPEMDQGTLMRWLNETMWFPAVWATDVISWEPIDQSSAIGSACVDDLSVAAEFRFDEDGRLVDFRADRYRDTQPGFEMTAWSTPLTEHARFNGMELPSAGGAVWSLESGDFEYIRIRVTDVRYSGESD